VLPVPLRQNGPGRGLLQGVRPVLAAGGRVGQTAGRSAQPSDSLSQRGRRSFALQDLHRLLSGRYRVEKVQGKELCHVVT